MFYSKSSAVVVCSLLLLLRPPLQRALLLRPILVTSCRRYPQTTFRIMSSNVQSSDDVNFDDFVVCSTCRGEGRLYRPPSRKARARHKRAMLAQQQQQQQQQQQEQQNDSNEAVTTTAAAAAAAASTMPPSRVEGCPDCQGSGLVPLSLLRGDTNATVPPSLQNLDIAIVGGGLAGLALATALRHRGMACTVYERDTHFGQRAQGYGLTLQQASKAMKGLGIVSLQGSMTSTKHVVHTPDGTVVGQWGLRHWRHQQQDGRCSSSSSSLCSTKRPRRQNVHVARQSLRHQLWQTATGGDYNNSSVVCWNHRLIDFHTRHDYVELTFQVSNDNDGDNDDDDHRIVRRKADLLVGADGIRSCVRQQLIGEERMPLQYLGCIVILGICPIPRGNHHDNNNQDSPIHFLLDGETVFQTADGTRRIYMMPYSLTEYMWQLSFPMEQEAAAIALSQQGPQALLQEAMARCQTWHDPVPQILGETPIELVSGYPVYDRQLLTPDVLRASSSWPRVTLIGDACHSMSPFKGQGANQALLDALYLARTLYASQINNKNDLEQALQTFEQEMLERSAVKVKASAQAAHFLHTHVAIEKGNVTRGGAAAAAASSAVARLEPQQEAVDDVDDDDSSLHNTELRD